MIKYYRYHKTYNATDPQKFTFSEVMLYMPHDTELSYEEAQILYQELYNGERKVDIIKRQVMEHLQDVTEARFFAEEALKDVDLEETEFNFNAVQMQENADFETEGNEEHPGYGHIDPDLLDNADECIPMQSRYRKVEIPSLNDLKENTRNLDEHQRHVVDVGIRYAKDMVMARKSCSAPPKPPIIMVHGGAGAGKSTVINVLAQWVQLILQKEGDNSYFPCVIKVAPTGTAAANIEGQTLHTAFSFSYDGKPYSLNDKARDERREILKDLKMVSKITNSILTPFILFYLCYAFYSVNAYVHRCLSDLFYILST